MADIAVFHPSLMTGGGGEAVCAHTVSILSEDHNVTIYSTDEVDLPELSEFHGVNINTANTACVKIAPLTNILVDAMSEVVSKFAYETNLEFLRKALAQTRLRSYTIADHDLYLSTWNELFLPEPVVQYVHFPTYHQRIQRDYDPRSSSTAFRLYYRLCSDIARSFGDVDERTSPRTLANSSWTANLVEEAYGIDAEVVYPPVHVDEFSSVDWTDKDPGFVAIGRIHPLKRQIEMIHTIDELRRRGIDTHIHIIGPTGDPTYYERVSDLAASRGYVQLHGKIPRQKLVSLVEEHRYGLHAREFEHFGIAVAEMVAGGAIPFVPESGGQTDIVKDNSVLTYEDMAEATDNIERVMNDIRLQEDLRMKLQGDIDQYSSTRFEETIKTVVEAEL